MQNKKTNEPKPAKTTKSVSETISLKEVLILAIGIIVIFGSVLWFASSNKDSDKPKTITEMHMDNYNQEPTDENYIYNGFSFLKLPDSRTQRLFWYTQYESKNKVYDIPMRFGPKEVDYINKTVINSSELSFTTMYITIDPMPEDVDRQYLTLAVSEFSEKMNKIKELPLVAACTKNETTACANRPIINCENTKDQLVVYFMENTEPEIIIDNNCITIKGTNETLMHSTDYLIYDFLGIVG